EEIPFTEEERKEIIDFHKKVRSSVNPPASNMMDIRWDSKMELLARNWASKCKFSHPWNDDSISEAEKSQYFGTSQSLARSRGRDAGAVRRLLSPMENEKDYYQYGMSKCRDDIQCAHYVNMIKAETYKVACVKQYCETVQNLPNTEGILLMVCQYSPGTYKYESGYSENIETPYKTGKPCSSCERGCTEDGKFCLAPDHAHRLVTSSLTLSVALLLIGFYYR
ncbi:Peptidase inhibitor 16, partial [Cichlidogyrus casuarinus]